MNLWFVAWVFIATFILGTSFWSYTILMKQKRAWKIVSEKCNLRYTSTATFKSATLTGMMNGFEVEIFADQPLSGKFREGGSRTIFQLVLKGVLPSQGLIGSMSFKNFIDGVLLQEKYIGEGTMALSPEIYNKVRSQDEIKPYFTKERVNALNALMVLKISPSILIASPTGTLLRVESTDPFDDAAKLEKFLGKLIETSKILSV